MRLVKFTSRSLGSYLFISVVISALIKKAASFSVGQNLGNICSALTTDAVRKMIIFDEAPFLQSHTHTENERTLGGARLEQSSAPCCATKKEKTVAAGEKICISNCLLLYKNPTATFSGYEFFTKYLLGKKLDGTDIKKCFRKITHLS